MWSTANWATLSPGYMELTESGSHPSSFALLPSSNECKTHVPPTSLYHHQSDFTTNSKLDNLIGSGYGEQPFCHLMMHHHTLPVCDRHVNHQPDSYMDSSPQSNKSRLIQSEVPTGVQPTSANPISKTPVGLHDNFKSKPRAESTDNSKSSAFTDVPKSMGAPAASSLLLYQSDRQPSSAMDTRQHLTSGSFVWFACTLVSFIPALCFFHRDIQLRTRTHTRTYWHKHAPKQTHIHTST